TYDDALDPDSTWTANVLTETDATVIGAYSGVGAPDQPEVEGYNVYVDGGGAGDGTYENPYGALSEISWGTLSTQAQTQNVYVNLLRGQEWNEQMNVGGSGTDDHRITIRPYGEGSVAPIVNGGERVVGWNHEGSNIWSLDIQEEYGSTFRSNFEWDNDWDWNSAGGSLFMDGITRGVYKHDGPLTDYGDWSYEEDDAYTILFYRDPGEDDPNTKIMEVNQRQYGIYINYNYITVEGIDVKQMSESGVRPSGANCGWLTVQDCHIFNCGSLENSSANGIGS
ncbi:unnamed protein product, partial [marine sediment metagenome]